MWPTSPPSIFQRRRPGDAQRVPRLNAQFFKQLMSACCAISKVYENTDTTTCDDDENIEVDCNWGQSTPVWPTTLPLKITDNETAHQMTRAVGAIGELLYSYVEALENHPTSDAAGERATELGDAHGLFSLFESCSQVGDCISCWEEIEGSIKEIYDEITPISILRVDQIERNPDVCNRMLPYSQIQFRVLITHDKKGAELA